MRDLIKMTSLLVLVALALASCSWASSIWRLIEGGKMDYIRGAALLDDSSLWDPKKTVPAKDAIEERDWAFTALGDMNAARLAVKMDYFLDPDGRPKESGFAFLDGQLAMAEKYGLGVIVDMHVPPGGAVQDYRETPEALAFWKEAALKELFVRGWSEIARRYAGDERIIAFELMNEPSGAPDEYWGLMGRTIAAIRETDQARRMIVQFDREGKAKRLDDTKMTYSFHFYEPMGFTSQALKHSGHPGSLAGVRYPGDAIGGDGVQRRYDRSSLKHLLSHPASVSRELDAPVIIGEFGVSTAADEESERRWIEDVIGVSQELGLAGYLYWRQIAPGDVDLSKPGDATMAVVDRGCYYSPAQFFGMRPGFAQENPGFDGGRFYRNFGKPSDAGDPCAE
jgi:hypothetical protein